MIAVKGREIKGKLSEEAKKHAEKEIVEVEFYARFGHVKKDKEEAY